MARVVQRYSRARMLMARNRAFTPFNPARMVDPVPGRLVATPAEEAAMRAKGIEPISVASVERHGADYPYPAPQIFQGVTNLDDILAQLQAGGMVSLGGFRTIRNTVADRFRFWIETANPDTFALLRFMLLVNGLPFVQQQFFTLPFVVNMQGFFRQVPSQALLEVVVGLRPGAVPIPPLGTIEVQIFADAYQGKFQ